MGKVLYIAGYGRKMGKVLYIAGYGRSGSTLLDIVLGNHPEMAGVGELTFLLEEWRSGQRLCSCGASYEDCGFWKDFFTSAAAALQGGEKARAIEKFPFFPRPLSGRLNAEDGRAYRAYQSELLAYVRARSQKPCVVDSSKSARAAAGRFLALKKLVGEDVYVLHLIRDGLATMESMTLTGSNWALEGHAREHKWPGLRAAIGWVAANLAASMLGRRLGPGRYMCLRYEDFLREPAAALREIGRFCGIDPEPLIERVERGDSFGVGHRVGGNRVRLQEKVRIERPIPQRSGARLKFYDRLAFAVIGGWLNRRHGYRKGRAAASVHTPPLGQLRLF